MLELKQRKITIKTPMESMAEGIAGGVSALARLREKAAEKVHGLFAKKQTVTTTTTSPQITVDSDREFVLPALGLLGTETRAKIDFLKAIYGQSEFTMAQIAEGLKSILAMGLGVEELLLFEVPDVIALLKMWKIGPMPSSSPSVIYESIPEQVAARADVWLHAMAIAVAGAPAGAGEPSLEDILRKFVSFVSKEHEIQFEKSFKLFRLVIRISGGYMFPIGTLKMAAIWGLMQGNMEACAPPSESIIKWGAGHLAMWISLASHITTEGIASTYGNVIKVLSEESSEETKNAFYSFYKFFGGNSMTAKKYLAWNKTAGVLLEDESVDMAGAMRMMTTFTVGRSFIRGLTGKFKLGEYLKDLSPIPGKRTIHDVISLFRNQEKYNDRLNSIYDRLDGLVQDAITEENIEFAAECYYELLKLKLAYVPFLGYERSGTIVDPSGALLDYTILNTITLHAFSRINKGRKYNARRKEFKNRLQEYILGNQNQKYLEYFGEPQLPKNNEPPFITFE